MRYEFNNGLCHGGRYPKLYLAKAGEAVKFVGDNIPGYCVIVTQEYYKNGKWSSTDYVLELATGVRPLYFLSRMHGIWGEDLEGWGAVMEELQLGIEVTKAIVRKEYPRTAARLDAIEAFEAENDDAEIVVISFGSPTCRMMRDGYWEKEKSGFSSNGVTVTVAPDPQDGWGKAVVRAPEGSTIVEAQHRPGHHGGSWEIHVAVTN